MCNSRATRAVLESGGRAPWADRYAAEVAALRGMEADGLLRLSGDGIRLTPLGRLFVRNVCMVFDAHLGRAPASAKKPDGPRYSRTV
jgi:oxygen-independent coproporphyrinogen-3 oxidase